MALFLQRSALDWPGGGFLLPRTAGGFYGYVTSDGGGVPTAVDDLQTAVPATKTTKKKHGTRKEDNSHPFRTGGIYIVLYQVLIFGIVVGPVSCVFFFQVLLVVLAGL